MKKYLLLILSATLLLNACKKDDDYVFDKSPDERINEALAKYQSQLAGAEHGWKASITVDSGRGGTYSFYFKFNNQNRVTMVSDFDSASAVTPKESSWRLKAQQQPTLLFDTYSYLHVLADPNEATEDVSADINGGSVGEGLRSDFEFIFDNSTIKDDTIRMNGKVNGSKLVMTKATKAESDAYLGGQFTLDFSRAVSTKILTYFKRLTIGSQLYDIVVNAASRTITITWVDASGTAHSVTSGYYNTLTGVVLTNPIVNGTTVISSFSNTSFNTGTGILSATVGTQAATIRSVVIPVVIDKEAANRWWQYSYDTEEYWISYLGFHVNGVDDGFNVRSLTRYYYMIYWAEYGAGNDLFAPIFINAAGTGLTLNYGAAPRKPTVTTDGRAVFTLLGNYGTYPTTGPARLSRNQLLITEGYYFVQTSATSYDMVSARDGLAWITWEF